MNRRLLEECVETMREEDEPLSEAQDFSVDPVRKKLVAREHGFAVISASRDNQYFRPAKADSKRELRRFKKSGFKPEYDPAMKEVNPEVELASRFGRIVPDRKTRTNALKQDLVHLGWEFRPDVGGYKNEKEDAGGGEHTFIVYPCKYDHAAHRKIVGDFPSDEEEIANWTEFKRDMLWLGQRYRQVAVYFAEPLCMHKDEEEAARHISIRSSDALRRNGEVVDGKRAGDTDFQARHIRPSRPNDLFFTNLDARTGRTKETRSAVYDVHPNIRPGMSERAVRRAKRRASSQRERMLGKLDLKRLSHNSFTAEI